MHKSTFAALGITYHRLLNATKLFLYADTIISSLSLATAALLANLRFAFLCCLLTAYHTDTRFCCASPQLFPCSCALPAAFLSRHHLSHCLPSPAPLHLDLVSWVFWCHSRLPQTHCTCTILITALASHFCPTGFSGQAHTWRAGSLLLAPCHPHSLTSTTRRSVPMIH